MKKNVRTSLPNQLTWINDVEVQQVLPTKYVRSVGPFILVDHISSWRQSQNKSAKDMLGKFPVPRRGAITLTYIIKGKIEHIDSKGNYASLASGCMQWLNAGFGIVCDQAIKPEFKNGEAAISIIRAWINLPSKQKSQPPACLSFCNNEIPKVTLSKNAGWIRILCGNYGNVQAQLPSYSKQCLYHIHIAPAQTFSMMTGEDQEYAAFLPTNNAVINELPCQRGEFILFSSSGKIIEIESSGDLSTDIILFGGKALSEPLVHEDGFVMNSPHEITQAYNDYYDGKYGNIPPT
ncbi:MAG TPA: pirin family protein [Puia sp.]|jgi:redox-sensitive bicupin YhaK (pirin superfamily)|nr:pirin family protein [Puia sp.]